MAEKKILLVGCGAMGSALIKGFAQAPLPHTYTILTPHESSTAPLKNLLPFRWIKTPKDWGEETPPDCVIFAVKPAVLPEILTSYQRFSSGQTLFMSVAAATPLTTYLSALGPETPFVRAMPNTGAAFQKSVTALFAGPNTGGAHKAFAQDLFSAVGEATWIEDEALMHVVTALSGSGPAYFYRLMESLEHAGVTGGLPRDLAEKLVRQTAIGVGTVLENSDETPSALREQVTSPQGLTAAALESLDSEPCRFSDGITQAIQGAIDRSHQIEKDLS